MQRCGAWRADCAAVTARAETTRQHFDSAHGASAAFQDISSFDSLSILRVQYQFQTLCSRSTWIWHKIPWSMVLYVRTIFVANVQSQSYAGLVLGWQRINFWTVSSRVLWLSACRPSATSGCSPARYAANSMFEAHFCMDNQRRSQCFRCLQVLHHCTPIQTQQ